MGPREAVRRLRLYYRSAALVRESLEDPSIALWLPWTSGEREVELLKLDCEGAEYHLLGDPRFLEHPAARGLRGEREPPRRPGRAAQRAQDDMNLPRSAELTSFHDSCLANPGWPQKFDAGIWQAIETNHRCNCRLWEQEDLARRRNVPDGEIAANKRAIDAGNQKRNDAIERIDEAALAALAGVERRPGARLHSETAGAMIDRLSILALKVHHMRRQAERSDVERAHIETCNIKLQKFMEQRSDLAACLDALLAEAARGEAWFKVYRQFKMYNDPALNPALYNESKRATRS